MRKREKPVERASAEAPKGFREKLENFWFYYKIQTLLAVFILFVAGYSMYLYFSVPQPDYRVALCVGQNKMEGVAVMLEEKLAAYGEDLNGDGRVTVEVTDFSFDDSAISLIDASERQTHLLGELEAGKSIIWITDTDKYNYCKDCFYGDILFTPIAENARDYLAWSETDLQKEMADHLKSSLRLSVREYRGNYLEGKKDIDAQQRDGMELVRRIIANERTAAESE